MPDQRESSRENLRIRSGHHAHCSAYTRGDPGSNPVVAGISPLLTLDVGIVGPNSYKLLNCQTSGVPHLKLTHLMAEEQCEVRRCKMFQEIFEK